MNRSCSHLTHRNIKDIEFRRKRGGAVFEMAIVHCQHYGVNRGRLSVRKEKVIVAKYETASKIHSFRLGKLGGKGVVLQGMTTLGRSAIMQDYGYTPRECSKEITPAKCSAW